MIQKIQNTLEALNKGDHKAYEDIYVHYVSSVKNFLTLLTRSEEAGEEITQEVFVTLWEKREQVDPGKNISGYLYTIAKNYALKYFNKNKQLRSEELTAADNPDYNGIPDEIYIKKEKELLVEITVAKMPAQRRKIYEMSRREGLSNSEIAERLNISKNTVENHITAALKDIREVVLCFLVLMMTQ